MNKEKNNNSNEDFDQPSFLDQCKLKEKDDKIKSGETKCNIQSPHECEGCGA